MRNGHFDYANKPVSLCENGTFVFLIEVNLPREADESGPYRFRNRDPEVPLHLRVQLNRSVYRIGCTFSSETGTVSDWQCEKS